MNPREMIEKLIAFDTVSRKSNLALIDYVRDYLDGFGVQSHLVSSDDGQKANLYATVGPMIEGGVVLSGHTDVVPVDGQPWESDPFRVVERDGKLFGRGTCDMKSFYAIALALLPEMNKLQKPIHFALSYDEEVGCKGAPRMIRQIAANLPRPEAVIIGEPTEMRVVTAHKGITSVHTVVTGHEAHSSQTHRGVSAVMTAAKLIDWLGEQARQRCEHGPHDTEFEPPYTTVHVGTVKGGTAVNIISRHCEFGWDVRHIPGDDPDAIVAAFRRYCEDTIEPAMQAVAPETGIRTEIDVQAPALQHEADNAAIQLAKSLTGQNDTYRVPFATEGGQFQQAGLPAVVCGPGSIDQAHQPNEYIALDQVEAGIGFIRKLIVRQSQV
ncbi:MAG: acetylornithine deacetylase [Gammaproteobacteria bacterium]